MAQASPCGCSVVLKGVPRRKQCSWCPYRASRAAGRRLQGQDLQSPRGQARRGATMEGAQTWFGPVAQLAEQLTLNQWVGGSTPPGLTIENKALISTSERRKTARGNRLGNLLDKSAGLADLLFPREAGRRAHPVSRPPACQPRAQLPQDAAGRLEEGVRVRQVAPAALRAILARHRQAHPVGHSRGWSGLPPRLSRVATG